MKKILSKLGLIHNFKIELETSKQEFVNKLRNQFDISTIDMFGDMFDIFSSSKNAYKGIVNHNFFEIKKRRRFFDRQFSFAIASGTYKENNNDNLTLEIVINGWSYWMYFFYGFALIFYITFLFMISNDDLSPFPFFSFYFMAF